MARVLILSSFVAASRVGGGAQALALARLGIEPILVPTVLFGRHPGHGPPGGAPVDAGTFEAVLGGVESSGVFETLSAVVTGHFSDARQVAVAAEALERVREAAPLAQIVVDPIMGDADKGLYVREPVAEAIAAELVPVADYVRPNAWELERLTGHAVTDAASAAAACRALGKPTLASSVPVTEAIGVVYAPGEPAWLARHARSDAAPKGTGDLLTATFVAGLILADSPLAAFEAAVGAVAEAVPMADGEGELPLDSFPVGLAPSTRVSVERVSG